MYRLYWQVHMHSCKTGLWATHTREIVGHQLGLFLPQLLRLKIHKVSTKNGVTVRLKNTLLFSMIFIQQAVDSYIIFDKLRNELLQLLESRRNELIQTRRYLFQPCLSTVNIGI